NHISKGHRSKRPVEMMELLGLKHRPLFRDNYLFLVLEYIEMKTPDNPNSSRQNNCRYQNLKLKIILLPLY
ncbi:Fic family protein, partial [Proteocatella sphenisci]|uniref:Fic family protein n=1 Tax=Proteocatella sphenisci TaxID=181070 RepID=UPI002E8E325C